MSWRIGKCDRCGEPKGEFAACTFKVRVLAGFLWWKRRVWQWWCDDCTQERYTLRFARNVIRWAERAQGVKP